MPRQRIFAPIRPRDAIRRAYRRRLEDLIVEMHRSVIYWVRAAYRRRQPEAMRLHARVAQDASPTSDIGKALNKLTARWRRKFYLVSVDLAKEITADVKQRSDDQLIAELKRWGESARLRHTRATNDVLRAAVEENVALIRSIPDQYLSGVRQSVMRSVQRGADINSLTQDLGNQFGVTHRRAELIARDQTNKVTSYYARTRFAELGIKQAVWVHTPTTKQPRASHVRAGKDKIVFDLATGWYDPEVQRYVLPGELISCRCVAKPLLPEVDTQE